jgi:hypothetical protein
MSEEMGVSWFVLGPDLAHVGTPHVLGRPSGVARLSSGSLVALDPNGSDESGYQDLLRRVQLSPLAEAERLGFAAPDRPESRWAIVDSGRLAAIVRKHEGESAFEIGAVELGAALEAPAFTRRDVTNAHGALAAVVFDRARARLVALLGETTRARLVTLPLDPSVPSEIVELPSPIEPTKWWGRQLVLHAPSDTLLVATTKGTFAFRGTEALLGFAGARYAAPLAVAGAE